MNAFKLGYFRLSPFIYFKLTLYDQKHHCPSSKMFSPNLNWKRKIYHLRVTNDKSS